MEKVKTVSSDPKRKSINEGGVPKKKEGWNIYFFGAKVGLSSFLKKHYLIGLKQFLYPIGYWRFPVFSVAINILNDVGQKKILDIGSPKLLSLYLALIKGYDVFATDLQDKMIFKRYYKNFCDYRFNRREGKYIVEYQDARRLQYRDASFDYVYSISVIEHIPDDGDKEAMMEINRVLKPMGKAIIEVPFSQKERETYVR